MKVRFAQKFTRKEEKMDPLRIHFYDEKRKEKKYTCREKFPFRT